MSQSQVQWGTKRRRTRGRKKTDPRKVKWSFRSATDPTWIRLEPTTAVRIEKEYRRTPRGKGTAEIAIGQAVYVFDFENLTMKNPLSPFYLALFRDGYPLVERQKKDSSPSDDELFQTLTSLGLSGKSLRNFQKHEVKTDDLWHLSVTDLYALIPDLETRTVFIERLEAIKPPVSTKQSLSSGHISDQPGATPKTKLSANAAEYTPSVLPADCQDSNPPHQSLKLSEYFGDNSSVRSPGQTCADLESSFSNMSVTSCESSTSQFSNNSENSSDTSFYVPATMLTQGQPGSPNQHKLHIKPDRTVSVENIRSEKLRRKLTEQDTLLRRQEKENENLRNHIRSTEREAKSYLKNIDEILDSTLCIVCCENTRHFVFMPCGHLCCCEDCQARLSHCPTCRALIMQRVRTYI
eukprot:991221_1